MQDALKIMPPICFHGNYNKYKKHNNTIWQILSYKTLLFKTITTISYAFLPGMIKSLHAVLIKICMAVQNVVCLSYYCHHFYNTPPHYASMYFLVFMFSKNWVQFFPHGGIQSHPFASCVLPCQIPFCQTAPLLPPVAQQQNVMEHSTSTAIPLI